MKDKILENAAKEMIVKLVKEHKERCRTGDCNISGASILCWMQQVGVTFTEDERRTMMS
jgi:hypothetical protein